MSRRTDKINNDPIQSHGKQQHLPFGPDLLHAHECVPSRPSVLKKLKPTIVYDTYWRFAAERQAIFFRRAVGAAYPWTDDPILREYRFTNVYRASDRVSQYLIRNVIYAGDQSPNEVFFRTLLFTFFNKIETWETLSSHLGLPRCADFDVERYDHVLSHELQSGHTIYSAAYIMPSAPKPCEHRRKHRFHLALLSDMLKDDLPGRIAESQNLRDVYTPMLAYPSIGPFLAYQFTIDLNYSDILRATEMDFVVPGPGG